MLLCSQTWSGKKLRDERVTRVAKKGDEGRVQNVGILFNEPRGVIKATPCIVIDAKQIAVPRPGDAGIGNERGMNPKTGHEVLQQIFVLLPAALSGLVRRTSFREGTEHSTWLLVSPFGELRAAEQLHAGGIVNCRDSWQWNTISYNMAVVAHRVLENGSEHVRMQEFICEIDTEFVEAILPIRLDERSTARKNHGSAG